jgi:hypothetical protein
MSFLKSALIAVAAALLSTSTLAAPKDPYIGPTVTPVPDEVTLRREVVGGETLDTSASFKLVLNNKSTNELSRVFLEGTATVVGSASAVATYDGHLLTDSGSLTGVTCTSTTVGTATKVRCDFAGALGGNDSVELYVIFKAPTAGDKISFAWQAGGDEGKSQTGKGCCVATGTAVTGLVDPTNNPSYKKNAQTFLRPTGGILFTGDQAKSTRGDPWSTKVVITEGTGIDYIATIQESESPASDACGTSVPTCFISTLDIDGTFANFLKITLRRDVSTIPPPDRYKQDVLDSATIYYSPYPLGHALYNPVQVYECSPEPTVGVPCWKIRTVYLRDAPADDAGDWLIELWASDNGSYRF